MNQAELVNAISDNTNLAKGSVKAVLDALGEVATGELADGGDVALPGIGKLVVKIRAARTGRNPATGEEIAIPEKRAVKLTVGKALKDSLA